jgi:hypothetical protein
MKRVTEWNQFQGLVDDTLPEEYINKFVTGESCALCCGAPTLSMVQSTENLWVIGSVQTVAISQQKQLQFLWEMGGRRGTIIPGRATGQLTISKAQIHGPSLLKAFYSYLDQEIIDALYEKPGNNQMWLNLNSEVFNRPVGIGLIMRDLESSLWDSFFLEVTYFGSHQFAMGANTLVLGENVSGRYEAIAPLPIAGAR